MRHPSTLHIITSYLWNHEEPRGGLPSCLVVHEAAGVPAVDNVVSGYNSAIFVYGQTGAGKTHTMMGQMEDPGADGGYDEEEVRWSNQILG